MTRQTGAAAPVPPGGDPSPLRGGRGSRRWALRMAWLLTGLASPLPAQLSVQPVIVSMAPAQRAEARVVTVANQGAAPLQLSFYAGDFDQAGDGAHAFFAFGEHPQSCRGRLALSPEGATLQPGEQQQVTVRMEPGGGTCWSLVFVESEAAARGGIRAMQRIGVKVYGISPDERREAEVTAVRATAVGGEVEVALEFQNLAGMPLRPEGTLEIRSAAGELVHSQVVEAFSVLPGRRRAVELSVKHPLPPGRYVAVPVLDFGGEYLAGGQAAFEVPPPTLPPAQP